MIDFVEPCVEPDHDSQVVREPQIGAWQGNRDPSLSARHHDSGHHSDRLQDHRQTKADQDRDCVVVEGLQDQLRVIHTAGCYRSDAPGFSFCDTSYVYCSNRRQSTIPAVDVR